MPKLRVQIPKEVAATVLVASDRTCGKCNDPSRPVQIHHIDEDPSNNSVENLAVLCLLCHDETMTTGGFGRHLDAYQVRRFQSEWIARVASRRAEADRLIALAAAQQPADASGLAPLTRPQLPSRTGLVPFVRTLPTLRKLAYLAAEPGWATGVTSDLVDACYGIITLYENVLTRLARFYPAEHFDCVDPSDYIAEVVRTRFRWYGYVHRTEGTGFSGTIVFPLTCGDVVVDLERMIEAMVSALCLSADGFSYQEWKTEWRSSADRWSCNHEYDA